jgi:hypothetical protein
MRTFFRLTTLAAALLVCGLALPGCSSEEGPNVKTDGGAMKGGMMEAGAINKGKMESGAMDKGKMEGGALDKGKMDGAMDKGKMD